MDYQSYSASPSGCEQQQPNFCTEQFSVLNARFAAESTAGWTVGLGLLRTVGDLQGYNGYGRECDGSSWGCGGPAKYLNRLTLMLPDGSSHEFRKDDAIHASPDESGSFYSVDGSGLRYQSGVLYLPDGSKYEAGKHTDANGNIVSFANGVWTDTLGREFTLPQFGPSANEGDFTYSVPGVGTTNSYKLKWRKLEDVRSDSSQALRYTVNKGTDQMYSPYLFEGDDNNKFVVSLHNPVVLSEIVLPDGEAYKFTYNVYGEIDKVVYPTGAYERFLHGQVTPLQTLTFPYAQANRGVVEKWVSRTGSSADEQHWTYSSGAISGVGRPDGTSVTTTSYAGREFNDANRVFGFDDSRAGKPTDEKVYAAGGALKQRTLSKWEQLGGMTFNGVAPDSRATRDPYLSKQISIVFEGGTYALMQMSEYTYDSNSDPTYFAHLNLTRTKQYGFVPVAISTAQTADVDTLAGMFTNSNLVAVSETDYSYDASYKARGILSRPIEKRVLNPTNLSDVLAKTQYVYDEAAYFDNSYTTTNWENPNSQLRGNVTTTRTWVKESNTWLETHSTYDNFGNVRKVWDASGDTSKFVETQYDASFKYAYPTKMISPAPSTDANDAHATNQTSTVETDYDFDTGLPVSVKDDFGQITATEYDNMLRSRRVYAANFTAPETQAIYGEVDGTTGQIFEDQRFVKVRKQLDATNWDEATTWFDAGGRTIRTQTKDSQGDVFVDTHYDSFGRVDRVTNPYRNGDTVYWSKTRYDASGRPVETYAPATIGDITANNLTSLGVTSFDISTVTNFVGTVVMTTDASGRRGRSITNALGQLIRVDEPTGISTSADTDLGTLSTPNQATIYTYDLYGRMVRVQQGVQNR